MPNSALTRPINYLIKHWTELTLFLRIPGAPFPNVEVEQLIKRCIRHRKNSFQYKTLQGAHFGDLMMSLVQTCRYMKESAHDYLTVLGRYAEEVIEAPRQWLPWNYRGMIPSAAI